MEKLGYILSEVPIMFLVIWFAVRTVQFRRYRNNRPILSREDLRLLHARPRIEPNSFKFYVRFVLAVLSVAAIGLLEVAVLSPFGAAIVAGAFLLTSTAIVRYLLVITT
jgi:hypothetical protein